jgi:hypothetical protein
MKTTRTARQAAIAVISALLISAPATGRATPPAAPAQDAGPSSLAAAIGRDLGLSPQEYLRRAALAQRLSAFAAVQRQRSPGSVRGIWLDHAGRAVVVAGNDAARAAARQAGFVLATAPAGGAYASDTAARSATAAPGPGSAPPGSETAAPDSGAAAAHSDATGPAPRLPRTPIAAPVGPAAGGDRYMSITQPSTHQGSICSWAFTAIDRAGNPAALTAGHCNAAALADEPIAADQRAYQLLPGNKPGGVLGTFEKSVVDGIRDYSIVKIADSRRDAFATNIVRGPVGAPAVRITGVGIPVAGAPVCKSGSTTGFTCGVITSVDQPDPQRPPIRFKHTALTLPGDSGGALISGTLAMGIVSDGGVYSDPSTFPTDRPGVLPAPPPGLPSAGALLEQIGPRGFEQVSPPIDNVLPLIPQVTMIAQSVADVLAENPGLRIRTS